MAAAQHFSRIGWAYSNTLSDIYKWFMKVWKNIRQRSEEWNMMTVFTLLPIFYDETIKLSWMTAEDTPVLHIMLKTHIQWSLYHDGFWLHLSSEERESSIRQIPKLSVKFSSSHKLNVWNLIYATINVVLSTSFLLLIPKYDS